MAVVEVVVPCLLPLVVGVEGVAVVGAVHQKLVVGEEGVAEDLMVLRFVEA